MAEVLFFQCEQALFWVFLLRVCLDVSPPYSFYLHHRNNFSGVHRPVHKNYINIVLCMLFVSSYDILCML